MNITDSNSMENIVENAKPLAKQILKASNQIALEILSQHSHTSTSEFLTFVTIANEVMTAITLHIFKKEVKHV